MIGSWLEYSSPALPKVVAASKVPFLPVALPLKLQDGVTALTFGTFSRIASISSSVNTTSVPFSAVLLLYTAIWPPAIEFSSPLIPLFTPLPMEMIMITEEIPMIMPSMVRIERPLLLRIFINAILMYSHTCVMDPPPTVPWAQPLLPCPPPG